jgi:FkbM family methyltransferase
VPSPAVTPLLGRLNRLRIWHSRVRIGDDRLCATSLDRLVYLWYWKLRKSRLPEIDHFRSWLKPGMQVIDVGANLGVYSHLFARCVGPTGRVASFEPDPILFEALRMNAESSSLAQIQPHRLALGEVSGRARLSRDPFNSGDNFLTASENSKAASIEVETTTLDEFLGGAPADFIKIDVQGWELHVLRGMSRTLDRNPGVQLYLEFSPYALTRAGSPPMDLFTRLSDLGFEFTILRDGNPLPSSLDIGALARRRLWFANIHACRARNHSHRGASIPQPPQDP